jgi:hypothetical protein
VAGELKKLIIESYKKIDYADKVDEFIVMFNPTSYGQKYEVEYEQASGKGSSGSAQKFSRIKPREYTFDFIVDGTGVSSEKKEVDTVVKAFIKATTETLSDTHRPPYLKLSWGSLISDCILKSANITYTLFKPDGYPLRAKISATFAENIDDKKRTAQQGHNSPDLTHHRQVQEGDTLPLMAYRIYGDPSYYLQIARFNNLDQFRALEVGRSIYFPPLKQQKTS